MSSFPRHSIADGLLLICAVLGCVGGAGCSSSKPPGSGPEGDKTPGAPDSAATGGKWAGIGGNGDPQRGEAASGGKPGTDAGGGGDGGPLGGDDAGKVPVVRVDPSSIHGGQTWPVCRLVAANLEGIGGTDLGFTVPAPSAPGTSADDERLVFLFGDTWSRATDECRFPAEVSDDMQASIPARRAAVLKAGEPGTDASAACEALEIKRDRADDATSWRSIRLFEDAGERSSDKIVDTTFLRTPITGFSDGEHTYVAILRNEPSPCTTTADCPSGGYCSTEGAQYAPGRAAIGTCPTMTTPTTSAASPAFCVMPSTCSGGACRAATTGMCLAKAPFTLQGQDGPVTPAWFDQDPRRAIMHSTYIASAFWPDRPEDYAMGYTFVTRKFFNSVARSVAHFDPDDASANDYRPGNETLLMWGRPTFFSSGGDQSLLFLLYQPLADLLGADGTINWKPRYFAGYDDVTGKPRWSDSEEDALPVYGATLDIIEGKSQLSTKDIEFDLVNHDAITWVESLQRWVMLYGGSVPGWLRADTASGEVPAIMYEQPKPNAIHMRSAAHPWGRATIVSPDDEAWTLPEAIGGAEAAAPLLVCDSPEATPSQGCIVPRNSAAVLASVTAWAMDTVPQDWQTVVATCVAGNTAYNALYELEGAREPHLYGVNIIDSWTDDVSGQIADLGADERAVELYWNVSTWAPYQVVLMKTQLRARVNHAPPRSAGALPPQGVTP